MAELASGKDWETLFQEKIATPLNMLSTHFMPVDTAQGHSPMIGGGASSTIHDYAHFLEMILNDGIYKGNRILLGEWREMLNDSKEAVLISNPSWAGAYPWIDKENNVYGFFLTHVNVEKANKDGFSSFYASPVLPIMVRNILRLNTE
jgi:CubicO group peptidase (beta-lactamase class C family)